MPYTATPIARDLTVIAIENLPAKCFDDRDPVEPIESDASRDAFTRHGTRLSVLVDDVEVHRVFTHEPRAEAHRLLDTYPTATFALLTQRNVRHSDTGLPIVLGDA